MILDTGLDPVIVTSAPATITLTNTLDPDYNFNEHDFIMHTSVINGKRTIVAKGTYFAAKLTLVGFTYTLYASLKGLRGSVVTFYPYGQGTVTLSNTVYDLPSITCLVKRVKFFHINNQRYTDGCILELDSQSYYELALTVSGS